ncbi:MAG: hypothetical protein QG653_431, partial [Patescibacteria group bacterium]|nr:hypothetical protein [Patescibacteria group bacterium]
MFLKSYAHMVVGALFFLWHVLRTVVFALATFFIWVIGFKPVETMLIQATVFFGIIGVGVLFTVFPMWLLTLFASSAFIFPL